MNEPVTPQGGGLIRLRLDIAYDGRLFVGWAKQTDLRSVQGELERTIGFLVGQEVELTCAGRTDAGVHARGQVAHLDVPNGTVLDVARVNRALPDDIRVTAITVAHPDFDARFSAIWRRYTYRVADDAVGPLPLERKWTLRHPKRLDEARMNEAAQALVGEHDFAAFCKPRDFATTIREIQHLQWSRDDEDAAVMTIQADAFCHSMVRAVAGALIAVGDGRKPPHWVKEILDAGGRPSGVTVMPPHPLVLEAVGYPSDDELAKRANETRMLRTREV